MLKESLATKRTSLIRNDNKTKMYLTPYKYYNPNRAIISNVKTYNFRATNDNGTTRIILLRRSFRILVISTNRMSNMNSVERNTKKAKNKNDIAAALQLLLLYKIRRNQRRYRHHHFNQHHH
jgi:hypothetical protein